MCDKSFKKGNKVVCTINGHGIVTRVAKVRVKVLFERGEYKFGVSYRKTGRLLMPMNPDKYTPVTLNVCE